MSPGRWLFVRLSRSTWLARQLRDRRFMRRAVKRFLPGEDLGAALDAAAELAQAGIGAVLTQLGEQVRSREEAAAVRDHYLAVLDRVRERDLPGEISVKLTHLGLDADRVTCLEHVRALVRRAAERQSFVWIDMEESRYVDATLEVYREARADGAPVGLCLQAYLKRTPRDLESLLPLKPGIRLVKGAYSEPAGIAFPRKRDVDEQYFALASRLLGDVAAGTRPVFGTHDVGLIGRIRERAAALGLDHRGYEFHLLYGIRAAEQRALAAERCKVRVLVSYGSAWFAWYMRRLAERPANVWFVVRNLF